jgi:hypothetical protein
MMESALIAVAAFIAAFLLAAKSRRKTKRLKAYEECMGAFLKDAETLLNADATPSEVVDMVEFMAAKASDRKAAREFLGIILRQRHKMGGPDESGVARSLGSFSSANPQLGRVLDRAMTAALLAMTFNGGPIGTFVRRIVLFDAKSHEDRSKDLATNFRALDRHIPHAQVA